MMLQPEQTIEVSQEPDYWHGDFYQEVRSLVVGVATVMHNTGVDPTTVQPLDAWRQFADRAAAGQLEMERKGATVPQQYKDMVRVDSPAGRVFIAMWQFLDLRALLDGTTALQQGLLRK